MKKLTLFFALAIFFGICSSPAFAGKPVDSDGDGVTSNKDCNDNDASVWELNSCGLCEPESACGGECTATESPETSCADGVDNDCDGLIDGEDSDCSTGSIHDSITGTFNTPADITAKCLECHAIEGNDSVNSLHGMMPTPAPNATNMTRDSQKLLEINTFCSYPNPDMAKAACLGCHPTLGKTENLTPYDIDCLRCHNDAYKRGFAPEPDPANWTTVTDWQGDTKTYVPADRDDTTNEFYVQFNWDAMPGMTALDLIKGVHRPTTSTCLSCHAKAGGGDWTKRGDLGLSTNDPSASEDVHLASVANGGAGLTCTSCHTPTFHEIPGRGIDLRPTEGGNVKDCTECHADMLNGGHAVKGNRAEPDRHMARVACKSCHIPAFGKGGATELWRNWLNPHWNQALCDGQGAWAGEEHKVANVTPDHVFFDGTSYVYALGESLSKVDPISGFDSVADANGDVNDPLGASLLVPIKRHQSNMAVMSSGADAGKVIPYDVVWQFMTGLSDDAAELGKTYAGYSGSHEWRWLEAEMGLNHGVSPAANVAACTNCHHSTKSLEVGTESKLDKLGYALKDADKNGVVDAADQTIICSQCHQEKNLRKDWEGMHGHTTKGSGIGCTFCHEIERPERGLCEPCNPDGSVNQACIDEFVDTNYYDHCGQ